MSVVPPTLAQQAAWYFPARRQGESWRVCSLCGCLVGIGFLVVHLENLHASVLTAAVTGGGQNQQ